MTTITAAHHVAAHPVKTRGTFEGSCPCGWGIVASDTEVGRRSAQANIDLHLRRHGALPEGGRP